MAATSRRGMTTGSIALPAVASVPSAATPYDGQDMVIVRAAEWIAKDRELTSMHLRWQDLECGLFDKAKRKKISCERALQSNMPEAQAMRTLDAEISEAIRQLHDWASEINQIPATSVAGAVAKLELGVKVQGPQDWQSHARELLLGGIDELRNCLGRFS